MDFKYTSRPLLAGVLVALVLGATGCATMVQPLLANFGPAEGKTLRLEVYMFGKTDSTGLESSSDAHEIAKTQLFKVYGGAPASVEDDVLPYRWLGVLGRGVWKGIGYWSNGPSGRARALVADGVPLLKEGDWVDAYVPKGDWVFRDRKAITIVRLVCKVEDKACQKREVELHGKPRGQVIDSAYDASTISITPHYAPDGSWLPGKKPAR